MKTEREQARVLSATSRRHSLNGQRHRRRSVTTASLASLSPADLATLTLQWRPAECGDSAALCALLRELATDDHRQLNACLTNGYNETARALCAGKLCGVLVAADSSLLAARYLLPPAAVRRCPVLHVRQLYKTLGLHVVGVLAVGEVSDELTSRGVLLDVWRQLVKVMETAEVPACLPGRQLNTPPPAIGSGSPVSDGDVTGHSVEVTGDEAGAVEDMNQTCAGASEDSCAEDDVDAVDSPVDDSNFLSADFISLSGAATCDKARSAVNKNGPSTVCADKSQTAVTRRWPKMACKSAGDIFIDTSGVARRKRRVLGQ